MRQACRQWETLRLRHVLATCTVHVHKLPAVCSVSLACLHACWSAPKCVTSVTVTVSVGCIHPVCASAVEWGVRLQACMHVLVD